MEGVGGGRVWRRCSCDCLMGWTDCVGGDIGLKRSEFEELEPLSRKPDGKGLDLKNGDLFRFSFRLWPNLLAEKITFLGY